MNTDFSYSNYDKPDPLHHAAYLDLMVKHLPAKGAIIDLGCGDGNFASSLICRGYDVYGVDLSEGGIDRARQGNTPERFRVCSVYDDYGSKLGVPRISAIYAVEVIEHLYSPVGFLRNAHIHLEPNGTIILTTPYWGYLKNVLLSATGRMDRSLTALWEGGHIKHFSYRTLRYLLEYCGFEYVAFYGTGRGIPFLWSGMMMVARKPAAQQSFSKPPPYGRA